MNTMKIGYSRTVLLVNDHPGEREAICRHLENASFVVRKVPDYQAAVRFLETTIPSVVCLDLMLPRESGYELCEYIRNERRLQWLPILVMSERGSPEEMAHAEQAGANAYLKKPFPGEKLMKYLVALLDGPHSSRPSVRRLRRSEPPPDEVMPPPSTLPSSKLAQKDE
jgi:DNA-binding response OmpR family regulator